MGSQQLQQIYADLADIYDRIAEKDKGVFLGQPGWEDELRELSRVCRDLATVILSDSVTTERQRALLLSHAYRDLAEATEVTMGDLWEPVIRKVSRAARKISLAYKYQLGGVERD